MDLNNLSGYGADELKSAMEDVLEAYIEKRAEPLLEIVGLPWDRHKRGTYPNER